MSKLTGGAFLILAFSIAALSLIAYYLFREAVSGGITAFERLMILGPMFLIGFAGIGVLFVIGKKKQAPERLAQFRAGFFKVILLYGSTFVIFLLWTLWEILK